MSDVCVVHLVWDHLGVEQFKSFITSYINYPSGIEHDLIIIFQGNFDKNIHNYLSLVDDINFIPYYRKNVGYDLGAYYEIASTYEYNYFCFLNSYSKILGIDWLLKMYKFISKDDVGIVGATGSYESPYSQAVSAQPRQKPLLRKIISTIWKESLIYYYYLYYDPFPNYHVRTNAFIIKRELFLDSAKYFLFRLKNKRFHFECGRRGLSKRLLNMGLNLYVVGRDGKSYGKEDWWCSNTFRQGSQENLLVADNKTDDYQNSSLADKKLLAGAAWGNPAMKSSFLF